MCQTESVMQAGTVRQTIGSLQDSLEQRDSTLSALQKHLRGSNRSMGRPSQNILLWSNSAPDLCVFEILRLMELPFKKKKVVFTKSDAIYAVILTLHNTFSTASHCRQIMVASTWGTH